MVLCYFHNELLSSTAVDVSLFFDDFSIGAKFQSGQRIVTGESVAAFSELTGDVVRIHTDEEFARTTPFGRRIAQGAFVFSIATGLFTQLNLINDTLLAFVENS